MLLHIPDVLTPAQVRACLDALAKAAWADGRITAGFQSAQVKHNRQVPEDHPVARAQGQVILAALERTPLFVAGALPQRVFPPLFNRYEGGESFGTHVDNAIRQARTPPMRVRTDLSATLFLSPPDSYDGGELVIEDRYGAHAAKLPAGHMLLYPASSLHHVRPVTRGARIAAFFWIQSMLRSDEQRTLLFDLDTAIQQLGRDVPDHAAVVQLTGVYHNLLRLWAEV
ncbi:MAG TPA: Fe2+-dependent dioxygenase [Rhodopila sp.]|uniref:Fe2+-dependent dioxygenase n=1 Tax=Rhodopila sp. TaxID=2480087 RepID=UPI002C04BC53|nr:Fe2+-dependent dioxygenase [Rhodopila sp.]HVY14548.1 Fe2+-dependent dioxygenase [Rhodopila sp.]